MVDGADSAHLLFKDCNASGNARHGLHVNDGSDARVEGGVFRDHESKYGAGVDINTVRGGTVSGVKAHGNYYGVKVTNKADGVTVTGCTAWENDSFGIDVDVECSNIQVIANTVYKNGSHGIAIEWKSRDCLVARNRCRDGAPQRAPIFVDMSTGVVVAHNIVTGGDNGIQFYQGSANCAAYNNDVYGATGIAFGVAGDCANITLKNNIASQGRKLLSVDASSTKGFTSDYNCWHGRGKVLAWAGKPLDLRGWQKRTKQGAHSLAADPMFEDPATDKFSLRAGSPCIDAGVDVERKKDFAGQAVPQGKGAAMGAIESSVCQ